LPRIGHAQASSPTQDLEFEKARIEATGCEVMRTETGSGVSREGRAELQDILDFLREGDELAVNRLDRLGRPTRDAFNLVHELDGKCASLRVLGPEVTTAGNLGCLEVTVLGMMADMQLKIIRDRPRAGIEAAKRSGSWPQNRFDFSARSVQRKSLIKPPKKRSRMSKNGAFFEN